MMNGKLHAAEHLPNAEDLLNPFVHRLELSTTYDKIKTGVLTVAVLPFRVAAIMVLLVLAWLLACVGLLGLSEDDLRSRPMTGWRRNARAVICCVMRGLFLCGGFHWVTVKGKQATAKEAPVLALAPHSSYFDALPVVYLGAPSIVAKGETGHLPFFGKLINYTQPVYVWREDPNSRQNTIKEIIERATSDLDWPQVLIFPEGTCTNRSCLITFKPGAFYPGVPVQPVCLRYPNKLDTVTWTWEGPGALKLLWLTLTQVHSSCVIEFLPVYHPNEDEKRDPKLYANNVRKLMARALGIPMSDYTYDDCRLITRAKRLNIPGAAGLLEVQKLRGRLGLVNSDAEEKILSEHRHLFSKEGGKISYKQFAKLLGIEPSDGHLQQLFCLYDKESSGVIDVREYIFEVLVISKAKKTSDIIPIVFQVFGSGEDGSLSQSDLPGVLQHTLGMAPMEVAQLCSHLDKTGKAHISHDELTKFLQHKSDCTGLFSSNQWNLKNSLSTECLLSTGSSKTE
ncbi:lysophosphatidylcholine acyltransferase isoform X1 [Schistocerca americana]|uniref:lysophosphatidylcholine acyltransferase n=1 Tax=Schistocerca piceifrons TaxID=274613 RepID=UPI001F501A67|nr:lysophosphatidylcholine acyltransferase isoform X1 [Schistocerca americana]XP_047112797.1 lysophosphatidylcholine acyltransferase [Schistocerca piceifrons]XP_049778938.1 lysophosphatidylcholine acyltransferase isoform X1 [Schistocerca cancellata]XP_049808184.1 lysophosphatidylcholine acyltransferase [Schistocerca nitens]XP_049956519.1 lysophosphatidylcholine acyltransferase [Schistocerca serialis cubense]